MAELLRDSITARTARGAGWLLGWRLATRGLGLLSTLVLARILVPAEFGLVALATGLVAAVDALSQVSVQEQLVRGREPDRTLYDTAFTFGLLRAGLTAGLLAAVAAPLAAAFAEPRLAPVLVALAGATLLGGFENIGVVEFRRAFSFEREFQLFVVPRLVSVLLTIAAAAWLRDHRALVVGIVAQRGLRVLASYALHPYRPRLGLSAWRTLLGFSVWSWGVGLVGVLRDRCDTVVVGRLLGPASVGLYAVGAEVAALPVTELVEPLARVLFSGFAAARRSGGGEDAGYGRVLGVVALPLLPMTVGISLVADPLTRLMFGPGWEAAIPLVQVLALGGALRIASVIGATLLNAAGFPRETFRVGLLATVLRVPLVVGLVAAGGLAGCAWAVLAATAVEELLFLRATMRRFHLRGRDLLGRVWRPMLATLAMAAALRVAGLGWTAAAGTWGDQAAALVVATGLGAVVFAAALAASWFAAGRPRGAETEGAALLAALVRRVAVPPRRRPGTARA